MKKYLWVITAIVVAILGGFFSFFYLQDAQTSIGIGVVLGLVFCIFYGLWALD